MDRARARIGIDGGGCPKEDRCLLGLNGGCERETVLLSFIFSFNFSSLPVFSYWAGEAEDREWSGQLTAMLGI
jgi:hypothetical protein